tara:strand:+ start:705 stop:1088 length:384 start_codon:yes stop_codon:yes gene_type:complete
MPAGRPAIEVDQAMIDKVEMLAAQGLAEYQICVMIGISQETFIKKKQKYSELSEAIKRGKAKGVATISSSLFQKAKKGDNTSMIFYLCNRDPENWNRHDKPTETNDDSPVGKIVVEVVGANTQDKSD